MFGNISYISLINNILKSKAGTKYKIPNIVCLFYLSLTLEPAVKLKEVVFYGSNNSQAHIINKQR